MSDDMTANIPQAFNNIQENWQPHFVAALNDRHVKIAKIDGPLIWHSHPDSDEMLYLCSSKLILELEDQEPVVMKAGDMYVVSRGIRHRPVAENARIMMVEHQDTVNTGDEIDSPRRRQVTK